MWIICVLLILAVLAVLASVIAAESLISSSLSPVTDPVKGEADLLARHERNGLHELADSIRDGIAFIRSTPHTGHYMTAADGAVLHAEFYENGDSRKTLLLCHGFRSSGEADFSAIFKVYRDMGFNILMIDERAHRLSQGKYITMGAFESGDAAAWTRFLEKLRPDDDIILCGLSMGATVVLLASGRDDISPRVKGVIADCGYTDARSQFLYVLKNIMHIPSFPVMGVANAIMKRRGGWGFDDFSTLESVKHIRFPVLLIHGEADTFVPAENSIRNFEACTAPKTLVTVSGAEHGLSFVVDREKYMAALNAFLGSLDFSAV